MSRGALGHGCNVRQQAVDLRPPFKGEIGEESMNCISMCFSNPKRGTRFGLSHRRIIMCLIVGLSASCYASQPLTSTGMCQRIVSGSTERFTLKNDRLSTIVEIRETPFDFQKEPGNTTIWVLPKLTNLSKEAVSVTVSCALFDKEGLLVVALSQGWHQLDPGEKDFPLQSCVQRLPTKDFQRIHSCIISVLVGSPREPYLVLDKDEAEDEAGEGEE